MRHLTLDELEAGLPTIVAAPANDGTLELLVRRPDAGHRELLERAELSLHEGLVGDDWRRRPSKDTADGGPSPDRQLALMNVRVARWLAEGSDERAALAGDQLFVDLDLSEANLPVGTRLQLGGAVLEVTAAPHRGCAKFLERFGAEALRWVNTEVGQLLRLRGVFARLIVAGAVARGDRVQKIPAS